jgi:metal-responsive CopG/Arc/MetJ family transcriptional regulator
MQATVEIPDAVLKQLESLANREGATAEDLIRQLVEAHVQKQQPSVGAYSVRLPLIQVSETGPIQPVTGADLDEILSRDHLPS